jgi:hypothetical protein
VSYGRLCAMATLEYGRDEAGATCKVRQTPRTWKSVGRSMRWKWEISFGNHQIWILANLHETESHSVEMGCLAVRCLY